MKLTKLCQVTRMACDLLSPMIGSFYNVINSETAKLKADKSVFTIADGVVQHLLKDHLFGGNKFLNIVGEEDESKINITTRPFYCDELIIPDEFCDMIESVRDSINQILAPQIDDQAYQSLTVFIDPIDGTREFSTGLGEQCSICIGFADSAGIPVAGVVYRPLSQPVPTWAAGAVPSSSYVSATTIGTTKEEGIYKESNLNILSSTTPSSSSDTASNTSSKDGLLTSNGSISPFIVQLMKELNYDRVSSGGAGNKMLMLLEGKGTAYIQDRGVSRWDTCGAQAVLTAHGGSLSKLTSFISSFPSSLSSYTYLKSDVNLDFEPGTALLTPFNAVASAKSGDGGKEKVYASEVNHVKPYANLCGLLALSPLSIVNGDGSQQQNSQQQQNIEFIHAAVMRAAAIAPPSFD